MLISVEYDIPESTARNFTSMLSLLQEENLCLDSDKRSQAIRSGKHWLRLQLSLYYLRQVTPLTAEQLQPLVAELDKAYAAFYNAYLEAFPALKADYIYKLPLYK